MKSNREQAEKAIAQYITRNTSKSGPDKGKKPYWNDVAEFVSEMVYDLSIKYVALEVKNIEGKPIIDITRMFSDRAAQLILERLDELKAVGINIQSSEDRGEVDLETPIDADFEVVEDE